MVCNETLSKIANIIDTYKTVGFNGFGFSFPDELINGFYNKTARGIFEDLAKMNIEALKARYPLNYMELVGDLEFDSKADFYQIREKGLTYHYQLLKSLHCYLYQCTEGDIPELELYKNIEKLIHCLESYIINRIPEYSAADWK